MKWQKRERERENEMKLNDAFGFLFDSGFVCDMQSVVVIVESLNRSGRF